MSDNPERTTLDTTVFTRHPERPGGFIMDNWTKLVALFVIVFFILFVIVSKNVIAGYVSFVIWGILLYSFISHTLKLVAERQNLILREFVSDNKFILREEANYRSSGVVFLAGNDDHATGAIIEGVLYGHKIHIYSHRFSTGSGKNRSAHGYGVAEIELPKAVPHIFIDSKKNNWLTGETLDVFRAQDMVELEGDFNDHFRVFAVKDYAVEVLTLLNPAFMQSLMENAAGIEIELIDNKAFVYISNAITMNKGSIIRTFAAIEFLIFNLSKQLDTFSFTPNEKMPHYIQKSLYKKIKHKI